MQARAYKLSQIEALVVETGQSVLPIEKYLLMLLFAPDSTGKFSQAIRGNTWCQKQMFVLSKLMPGLEAETDFDAYAMGSYSETVAEVQDQFYLSGFADRSEDGMKLTLEGRRMAETIWDNSTDVERKVVSSVKAWLNDLTFNELLAILYTEYPESASKSEVRGQIDARRLDIAVALLKRRKVNAELAARIARMNESMFMVYLARRGITQSSLETSDILVDKMLQNEIEQSRRDSENGRLLAWEKIIQSQ